MERSEYDDIRQQLGSAVHRRLPISYSTNDFAMVGRQEVADIFKDLNVVGQLTVRGFWTNADPVPDKGYNTHNPIKFRAT